MDLLQLTYFCHAAQTENFSQTAAFFLVPPSNVSQTIKRLEQELGTRLFHREANKVTLNASGKAFYESVSRALELLEEGKRTVERTRADDVGEIKILVHTCRRIVTQTVEAFKNSFPNVSFVIHHTKDTANDDYDFIISDKAFPSRLSEKSVLLSENVVLACHKKHTLASLAKISAQELMGEEFITMSAGNSLHTCLIAIGEKEGFTPKIAIQSDDPYYVRKYLDEGLGIAFVPSVSWRGTFSENVILIPFGTYTRDTFVFHDASAFMPNVQQKFLSYLKRSFEKEKLPTV